MAVPTAQVPILRSIVTLPPTVDAPAGATHPGTALTAVAALSHVQFEGVTCTPVNVTTALVRVINVKVLLDVNKEQFARALPFF